MTSGGPGPGRAGSGGPSPGGGRLGGATPGTAPTTGWDGVVLAGGLGRRMGPGDKLARRVGGVPLLERVIAALAGAERIIVAGPRRAWVTGADRLIWVAEDPPGGGPVAGLSAALSAVRASRLVVLAGDLPFAAGLPEWLLDRLAPSGPAAAGGANAGGANAGTVDAVVPVDVTGRAQPLAAAYRSAELRAAIAAQPQVCGARLGQVLAELRVAMVHLSNSPPGPAGLAGYVLADCDTPEELEAARELLGSPPGAARSAPDPRRPR